MPTFCRNSSCFLERKLPSSQAAPLANIRARSLAASGPIPPHVPKAIGRNAHPASLQRRRYLSFFILSLLVRKLRHLSRVCVVEASACSACCHPCATVTSTATSVPADHPLRSMSAGRSCEGTQTAVTTAVTPRSHRGHPCYVHFPKIQVLYFDLLMCRILLLTIFGLEKKFKGGMKELL